MRLGTLPILLPAALLALGLTANAAQSVRFLRTERFEMALGERLRVGFQDQRGEALAAAAWPKRFDWFFVRAGGGQENLAVPRPAAGRRTLAIELTRPGITLIGADPAERVEELSLSDLRAFLAQRMAPGSLPTALEPRPGAGASEMLRVRRVESAKALVRVLGKDGFLPNSATAQSKTGQAVEIRPLADPTSVPVNSDLPLRIYVPNPGKAGTRVSARHLATGRTHTFLTDRMGTGFFTVTAAGVWTVEAHHARPAPDKDADWEIYSATLIFEVPPGDPRQGGAK
jgi:hypothetical protein